MNYRWHNALVSIAAHPVRWPLARVARRLGTIRVPGVGVIVSDARLASEIMQRDREFTKNGKGSISAVITQLLGPVALANMDGDAHRRLRTRLTDLLSGARVKALLDTCEQPLTHLRQSLLAGATVDLVDFMRTMSGRLAMTMIGTLPDEGTEEQAARDIVLLGERVTAAFQFRPLPPRKLRRIQADVDHLGALTRVAYEAVDSQPTSLVRRLRELGLSFEETRGVVSIFFVAGTLTTALAMPRVIALLIDSGQIARLQQRHEGIARALDEGLRYVSPIPATVRIANQDVTLAGRRITAGTRLVILTANLTRDPSVFPDPFTFDVDRVHHPDGRYLWYGTGPHFCFGFLLAQLELHRVLEALVTLPGRLEIVSRKPAVGALLPRYDRLTVRMRPA